jgi:hypothetical protein
MKEVTNFIDMTTLNLIRVSSLVLLAVIIVKVLFKIRKPHPDKSAAQEAELSGDDPLVDVLHRALANRTGKLRVSDAYLICGIEPGKVNQDQISRFSRTIRELGWERQRRRFDGSLQYAYVRGTAAEREVELIVEYDPHLRSVRIEIDKNVPPPTN